METKANYLMIGGFVLGVLASRAIGALGDRALPLAQFRVPHK